MKGLDYKLPEAVAEAKSVLLAGLGAVPAEMNGSTIKGVDAAACRYSAGVEFARSAARSVRRRYKHQP